MTQQLSRISTKACRFIGLLDLGLTGPLILPCGAKMVLGALLWMNQTAGLTGMIDEFQPSHLVFVNMMGALGAIWAVRRIWRPDAMGMILDSGTRLAVGSLVLYYIIVHDFLLSSLILAMSEYIGALVQLSLLAADRRRKR